VNEVSAALTTEELIELNRRQGVDQEDPDVVAKDWLEDNDLAG
jgi:osmoprotectant transport system substrate-binding protein